ncbi:hypothetical protein H0N98_01925 [Candidatus Micrarchaeota archaeon]|nr:hypothetical protein [Candidatus Micrarchaeota archaeon]
MRWKEFFDAVKLPVIALALLNLIDYFTVSSSTSVEGFKPSVLASIIMAFSFFLSVIILLYTGYIAVKKFKFSLIMLTLINLIVNFITYLIGASILILAYPYGISLTPIYPLIHPLLTFTVFTNNYYDVPLYLLIFMLILSVILGPIGGLLYHKTKQKKKTK